MIVRPGQLICIVVGFLFWMASLAVTSAQDQSATQSPNSDAPLVVEGVIQQIYTGGEQSSNERLVEIEVRRSEARTSAAGQVQARFPAPTETVYVHITQAPTRRGAPASTVTRLPEVGQSIRAYLQPRPAGGWQDASPAWFEVTRVDADGDGNDRVSNFDLRPGGQTTLGMTIEPLRLEKQFALRVNSVVRGSPAQSAGLEVGDALVGVNGAEITTADEITALAVLGEPFSLDVVDVNSGRTARIQIDPNPNEPKSNDSEATPAGKPASESPNTAPQTVSLGMSAESVKLGARSAIKVIRVAPAGLAAKAGLEPDDVIVSANGVPTTSVEQLLSALRKSGPTLELLVRDSRTGRDTSVLVDLGTQAPAPRKPNSSSPTTPKSLPKSTAAPAAGELGAVTELAFHDNDFAVKVTEVTPGSAAARAGLRPGAIIVAAGDKPVLHPNDLVDLVRKSQGPLKLTVIDPTSGKKSSVEVNLKNVGVNLKK